jgi:hypothetical protein
MLANTPGLLDDIDRHGDAPGQRQQHAWHDQKDEAEADGDAHHDAEPDERQEGAQSDPEALADRDRAAVEVAGGARNDGRLQDRAGHHRHQGAEEGPVEPRAAERHGGDGRPQHRDPDDVDHRRRDADQDQGEDEEGGEMPAQDGEGLLDDPPDVEFGRRGEVGHDGLPSNPMFPLGKAKRDPWYLSRR